MKIRRSFPVHRFIMGRICSEANSCRAIDCMHATPHRCTDPFSCDTMVCQFSGKEVTCVWMPHPDWKEVIVACNRTGHLCKQATCPHFYPHHFNPQYCQIHDECKVGKETRWKRGLEPCGCNVASAQHLYNTGRSRRNDEGSREGGPGRNA